MEMESDGFESIAGSKYILCYFGSVGLLLWCIRLLVKCHVESGLCFPLHFDVLQISKFDLDVVFKSLEYFVIGRVFLLEFKIDRRLRLNPTERILDRPISSLLPIIPSVSIPRY